MTVVEEKEDLDESTLLDGEGLDAEEQLSDVEELEDDVTEELSPEELLQQLKEKEAALEAERAKNEKLYEKFKKGQKKGIKTRQELKEKGYSKEDVIATIQEYEKTKAQEAEFRSKFDDVDELMPELTKLMEETGLGLEQAYFQTKGRLASDEGYRNQIMGERSKQYGNLTVSETTKNKRIDEILSDAPAIAKPRAK